MHAPQSRASARMFRDITANAKGTEDRMMWVRISTFRRGRGFSVGTTQTGSVNPGLAALALGVILLLLFRQTLTVPHSGVGLPPAQLVFLGCGLLWVLKFFTGTITKHILRLLVAIQACTQLASYFAGQTRPLTPEESLNSTQSLLQYFILAGGILFALDTLRSEDDVASLIRWIVVAGTVAAMIAVGSALTGIDLTHTFQPPGVHVGTELLHRGLEREGLMRTQGTSQHPLELGAVMAFLTPLALTCAVDSRWRGRSMIPWLTATVLIIAAGLYSVSRSAVLGSIIGIIVMMTFWPLRRSMVGISVLGLTSGAVLLSGLGVVDALISSVQGASNDLSLESRAIGRAYVMEHFSDHLWFGQGIGTYVNQFEPVLDNQYLQQVIECGLCGLAAAAVMTIVPLALAFRARAVSNTRVRDLLGGVTGSLAVVALIQGVLDTAAFLQFSTLTALGLGMVGALTKTCTGRLTD